MAQHNMDRAVDKVPRGFWKTLREYDKALYEAGEERPLPPDQRPHVSWQWQTSSLEASDEAIIVRPVHCLWVSGRSLGGLVLKGGLRVTEVMSDPEASFSEQEVVPGVGKLFTYCIRSRLVTVPRLKESHLAVAPLVHTNVKDSDLWGEETQSAASATVEESRATPGSGLLTPSPEDYDLLLHYMEIGLETDNRRPLNPQE